MDKVPQSELLSAYLDGELTAAERAQVEQLLAADPAARQLLEEFRALGKTLQSLPREKLGEDLDSRVLQLAQRRMAAETPQQPQEMRSPEKQCAEPPQPLRRNSGWRGTVRGMFSRQAIVWSGLAVAVAVMMTVWNHPRETRRIAMTPPPAAPVSAAVKPAEPAQSLTIQAVPEPAMPKLAMNNDNRDRLAAVPPPASAGSLSGQFRFAGVSEEKGAAAQSIGGGLRRGAAQNAPLRQQVQAQNDLGEIAQQTPAAQQKGVKSLLARSNVQVPSASSLGQSSQQLRPTNAGVDNERALRKAAEQATSLPPAQGVLVVYCEVTPEAAHQQTFNSLLTRNGMSPTSAGEKVAAKPEQIYVSATISQIEALLDQMKANRDAFPAVKVAPAPGVGWQADILQHKPVGKSEARARKTERALDDLAASSKPQHSPEKASPPTSSAPSATPKPGKHAAKRDDTADLLADGTPAAPAHVHRVLFVFRGVDDDSPKRGGR